MNGVQRLVLFLSAACAIAAAAEVSGPVLGYVVDVTRQELRPIHGLPGATVMGSAIALGFPVRLAAAVLCPGRIPCALVVSAAGGLFFVPDLRVAGNVRSVDNAAAEIDRIAWNQPGTAAVVSSSRNKVVQVVRGGEASGGVSLPNDLTALALSNDGELVVAGCRGAAYEIRGHRVRLLAWVDEPASVVFTGSDNGVAVADSATARILLFREEPAGTGQWTLTGSVPEVRGVAAFALAVDGRTLLVTTNTPALLQVDLGVPGIVAETPLPVSPDRCERLLYGSTFRLSGGAGSLIYLAVMEGAPAVYFVPWTR